MVDLTFLEKLSKGDVPKMKRYITMYLSIAPEIFDRMRNNLDEENWSDLALNVHSIKPQTDYMGVESLKEVLIEIENSASNGNYQTIPGLFQKAFELHEKSQVALNMKLNEL